MLLSLLLLLAAGADEDAVPTAAPGRHPLTLEFAPVLKTLEFEE